MLVCHHNAEQNHNLKTAIRCSDNVAKFKYLEMTVRNENLIHGETKSRLNLGTSLLQFSSEPFAFLYAIYKV
jgi:hypothetical protein